MVTYGPEHQGLTNMRVRAESLGGALPIERRLVGGTRVCAPIQIADGPVS